MMMMMMMIIIIIIIINLEHLFDRLCPGIGDHVHFPGQTTELFRIY